MFPPRIMSKSLLAKVLSSACLLFALPSAAFAQDEPETNNDVRFYAGAAIELIELNSFAGDSPNLFSEQAATAVIRGGAVLNRYFAVEGEAAIGISNESGDGIADYDNRFAGYGRARLPFGETGVEVFARLGYAVTRIESRNVVGSDGQGSTSLDGVTYGGGVAYNFGATDQFQIRIDYTDFQFGNDQDADSISIGLGYNF